MEEKDSTPTPEEDKSQLENEERELRESKAEEDQTEESSHLTKEEANEIEFEIENEEQLAEEAALPPENEEESLTFLQTKIAEIESKLTEIHLDFNSKIKYDRHKEEVIDKLHAELQIHKNGLLEKLLGPVFMDVVEVIDDTRRLLKDIKKKGEENNAEKLWKLLNTIPEDLEDMLYKHGVEVVQSDGDQFDPSLQKVVRAVKTDQEDQDKTVQERLKNGYEWEGKLLRRELVNIWKFEK